MSMTKLTQAGDTIIEVLMAVAIIGAVLVGAYVTANQSSKSTIQARERTNALKLAQSQLEGIKSLSADLGSGVFNSQYIFCLSNGNTYIDQAIKDSSGSSIKTTIQGGGAGVPTLPLAQPITYDPACVINNGIDYSIAIDKVAGNPSGHGDFYSYRVYVRWDSIRGGTDQVSLTYKVDKTVQ